MKKSQVISVQFPIPEKSVAAVDWAAWKRALEILWAETKSKSWGLTPVRVTLDLKARVLSHRVVGVILDALQEKGVLMDWKHSVRELTVRRGDREGPLARVVITIERRKG